MKVGELETRLWLVESVDDRKWPEVSAYATLHVCLIAEHGVTELVTKHGTPHSDNTETQKPGI